MNETIKQKLNILPDNPGCYLYKDVYGDVIYIGKAKNLKKRVKSYFTGTHNKKTQMLISNVEDIEYIIVNSEKEALILENNLIKQYKPHYNIRLKDDKSYPYLMITKENNPRLILTRNYKKNSKNLYFGPYVDIKSASKVKQIVDKIYPLRKCNPIEKRPCMYYQIGECIGPCKKSISADEYNEQISKIKSFLNGKTDIVLDELNERMQEYIRKLEFENAAKIHEYIKSIKISVENQNISASSTIDRDYIGYYSDKDYLCVQIFLSRQGQIIERKIDFFDLYTDYKEILQSYIIQYYALNPNPKEIYILDIDNKLFSDLLGIKVITPSKGSNKMIIDTVTSNAKYYLENDLKVEKQKENKHFFMLESLAKKIGVQSISNIDAFDNSNIMGRDAVSVKVNFLNGKKNTYGYRKFKVKYTEGINDIATMKEVLYRSYKEKDTKTNLIIVDGGKNHVTAAKEIIHDLLKLKIKIVGLVKNDKHRTEYLITDDYEIIDLNKRTDEYLFLSRIQDEVHRFAITYHRSLKTKNMFNNDLDKIKGIGIKRRKLLMENFKSFDEIKNANIEKLIELGIPKDIAKDLKNNL